MRNNRKPPVLSCGVLVVSVSLWVSGCMSQKVSLMTNEPFKVVCDFNNKETKFRGVKVIIVDPTLDYATIRTTSLFDYGDQNKAVEITGDLAKDIYISVLEKSPSRYVLGNITFINTYSRWLGKAVSQRTEYLISRETGDVSASTYYVYTDRTGGEDVWSKVPMDKSKYIKEYLINRATQPIVQSCKAQKF